MDKKSREFFLQQALENRLYENKKISSSSEKYIHSLFGVGDNKINGHGIDSIDRNFSPNIYYEIKTGKRNVQIPNTQFNYLNTGTRSYLIVVKRENNLKSYQTKRKNRKNIKIMNTFYLEESLLFDFGDIFFMPLEIIKPHYILQRAKSLLKKRYNISSYKILRKRIKKDIEDIIKKQINGKSISHDQRDYASLTFGQAAQIIIGYGNHYNHLIKNNDILKKHKYHIIDGPLTNNKDESKIFLMDWDNIVIDQIAEKLDNKKIGQINEIKKDRLMMNKEIIKMKEDWIPLGKNKDLLNKAIALSEWRYYVDDLFSKHEELTF